MIFSTIGLFKQRHLLTSFFYDMDLRKTILFWGKKHAKRRTVAKNLKMEFLNLEDGFLRSCGLGVEGYPPLALVLDDTGIYYDTTQPSRLEHLILAADMPSEMLAEAQQAMALIVENRLSKYNHAPEFSDGLRTEKPVILVLDQTFGDMAVKCGGADAETFETMFQTALNEHPEAEIWVKTHPDVLSGKKQGYLTDLAQHPRVRLLAQDINPISLIQAADEVYCVTSHMGFEALLCGKPVHVFGLPWYAGWGVSDDRHPEAARLAEQGRRAPRTLPQLFAAAYLQYSRYLNPNTGKAGTLTDVIAHLAAMRRLNDKLRGEIWCVGMSLWKRAVVKPFFAVPSCRLKFAKSVAHLAQQNLPPDARVLAWGAGKQELADFAATRGLPLLRMEDGFLRSVGLGSNLVPPLSLVIDDMGIYFDARTPSRLEHILQHRRFSAHELQTALSLQAALTEHNISKYNVGSQTFTPPPAGKTVILVPGQVEDDASVRFGSPEIRSNLDLLKTVRARRPDAYIIYKPHPDVVSGNRVGAVSAEEAVRYADQTAAEADISVCLQHADEVHTMTSLTGFEALLRGKKVCCYGQPFYAGWGLTEDRLPVARRTRRLSLPELIAGTLQEYPGYVCPESGRLIDAASAVLVLRQQKALQKNNTGLHRSFAAKQAGKVRQLWRTLTR